MSHFPATRAIAAAVAVLFIAGCDDGKKPATQAAARVNGGEISVHQINGALARAGALSAEQAKAAGPQVLERLIDQELLVQKAVDKKLDREPAAMLALEAARRDILARIYMESVTAGVAKPTTTEVTDFYAQHPELFSERRLYNFRQLSIAGKPAELMPRLQEQMDKARNLDELAAWLKGQNIPFGGNAATKAAEQLPLELLPHLHQMKDGQTAVVPSASGVLVIQLVASRTAPMEAGAATPFIEQFLANQRKLEASTKEIKQLREAAKIEYLGDFANGAEKPAPLAQAAAPAKATAAPAAPATASASAAPAAAVLEKGVAGLR